MRYLFIAVILFNCFAVGYTTGVITFTAQKTVTAEVGGTFDSFDDCEGFNIRDIFECYGDD